MSFKFSTTEDELLIEQIRKFPCIYDDKHKDYRDFQVREDVWMEISFELSKTSEDCKTRWKNIRDNYFKHLRRETLKGGKSRRPPKWPLYEHLTFLQFRPKPNSEQSQIQTVWQDDTNDVSTSDNDEDTVDQLELVENKPVAVIEDKTDNDDTGTIDLNSLLTDNRKRFKLNVEGTSRSNTPVMQSTTSAPARKRRLIDRLEEQLLTQFVQHKEEDDIDLFMRSIGVMIKKLPANLVTKAKLQILTVVTNIQNSATSSKQS